MKVIVTGGAGYIGSHTCKKLAQQGHELVVYDNLCTGHRQLVKWGDFVYGDILDVQRLRTCFKHYKPDGVIHFAAHAYVGESVENPGKYFRNNVTGTLSLLEAMRDEGVANIVVSSTCAVYGQPEQMPISEACPAHPMNPYGASKLFMERMLADFHVAYGLNWVALRYFNAAGCDPEGETGELHDPEPHLIPRLIFAALGKIDHVDVFGVDYPTRDGTCIRDYVHVGDLATAHIQALNYLQKGGNCEIINLGTGTGASVKELLEKTENVIQHKIKFKIKPRRRGDPPILFASIDKAKKILNWIPVYTDVEYMIQSEYNFINNLRKR